MLERKTPARLAGLLGHVTRRVTRPWRVRCKPYHGARSYGNPSPKGGAGIGGVKSASEAATNFRATLGIGRPVKHTVGSEDHRAGRDHPKVYGLVGLVILCPLRTNLTKDHTLLRFIGTNHEPNNFGVVVIIKTDWGLKIGIC